ncbi:DUF3017 domain-containing protein [Nocardioides sp. R-C-SC26]|uniref:DUF3017 domain-containing protein n=1 Tax=Nocardioides sp. R-C-SC26 TaxID=2870414 RepID=UPI001E57F20E|nr:DUF3017 domain-containing protein [Nocardioides sp. R-C-SC26]
MSTESEGLRQPGDPGEPDEALSSAAALSDAGDDQPPDEEPRRYPSTIGGAFYIAILVVATLAVAVVMAHEWRWGVRILAGCLGTAGLLRLVLPQRDAGMLAVRHRLIDVALLVGVGAALYWLAGSIPDQPG